MKYIHEKCFACYVFTISMNMHVCARARAFLWRGDGQADGWVGGQACTCLCVCVFVSEVQNHC